MLPDSGNGCSDPECPQGRLGHCASHNHQPRKPKPQYASPRHHPYHQNASGGGGYNAAMYQGTPGSMPATTQHYTQNTQQSGGGYGTINMYQGASGGMSGPMTLSHTPQAFPSGLAPGKGPSLGEEAEGPGAGPLGDDEQDCAGAARRLTQVASWMRDNGHTGAMLRDFAHSDSCNVPACSPFCRMFRRVRRHVQGAQHPCMLLRTYAVLLRLHVHSCNDEECGLRACPTLRNRQLGQNPNHQQQISTDQQEDRSSDVDMPEH